MAAADASGLLDSPIFVSIALPRRRARRGASRVRAVDDDYEVGGGIKIGLRTYPHAERPESRPLVLMWHGNGEVAADYDDLSSAFHDFGVNLTVVDFRGYGWGTDTGPLLTTVASDASALLPALDAILVRAGLAPENPIVAYGRSMGSVAAIEVASRSPGRFAGLILECPIARLLDLPLVGFFRAMFPPADALMRDGRVPDPFDNVGKIARLTLPFLLCHGEEDEITPITEGELLFERIATPADRKSFVRVADASHNDLWHVGRDRVHEAFRVFLDRATKRASAVGEGDEGDSSSSSLSSSSSGGEGGCVIA